MDRESETTDYADYTDFRNREADVNPFADFDVLVSTQGLVDPAEEKKKLEKKIAELDPWIKSMTVKLSNENFVARAPKQIIDGEKAKLEDAKKLLISCQEQLAKLK